MKKGIGHAMFIVVLLGFTVYALKVPEYNWDVIGYIGAASRPQTGSIEDLHRLTYSHLRSALPEPVYQQLAPPDDSYRGIVASDPRSLAEQIPFYANKPLYVWLIRLAIVVGVDPVRSPGLISALAGAGLAVFFYGWISSSLGGALRVGLALLGSVLFGIPAVARAATPDALSALLLVCALVLAVRISAPIAAGIVLCLSIAARPDNIIVGVSILIGYFVVEGGAFRRVKFLLSLSSLVMTYLAVRVLAPDYGYQTLFVHTFVNKLAYPASSEAACTALQYGKALLLGIRNSVVTPFNFQFWITILIGMLTLACRSAGVWSRREGVLIGAIVLAAGIHFLLFPVPDGRYYVSEAILTTMLYIEMIQGSGVLAQRKTL